MKEKIREIIERMSNENLINLHNDYCCANYYNNDIMDMCTINEILSGKKPTEILNMVFYGNFNPNDSYFRFNGIGYLESCDYPKYDWIDIDEIVDYIIDNNEDFDVDEIRDALDEDDEDDEDEKEEED